MRSIDLGKKFLGLALCFALSSSVVLANTLSEVQINADETSGYDIVLKTDSATEMKKVVSDDNKMYIELKNVQASDSLNTVYNNVANIENVTIQPVSKEDLKITLSVTVPQELAKDIEDLRGNTPRSEYLRVIIAESVRKQKAAITAV